MPPIWELIAEREAAANAVAQTLREQIGKLTDELAAAETELTELAITRKTLTSLTGHADAASADATLAGVAYQQILAVFDTAQTATEGMRAKDVCLALGIGVAPRDTEGIRAKLKRLVARQILVETEPGLFVLALNDTARTAL